MREILFRGKRIDNGEWIVGSLINDGRCFIAIHPSLAFGPTSKDEINGETLWGFYPFFEVDPSTIGQYTGLTDKNGKKIFEGDIILEHVHKNIISQSILFKPLKYVVKNKTRYQKAINLFDIGYSTPFGSVVGNIHDNPELLEDKVCD